MNHFLLTWQIAMVSLYLEGKYGVTCVNRWPGSTIDHKRSLILVQGFGKFDISDQSSNARSLVFS